MLKWVCFKVWIVHELDCINIWICVTWTCLSPAYLIRESPYCGRLTVGYGDLSEFWKDIQIHQLPPVPQDWPKAHFPKVIVVQISLHRYWQKSYRGSTRLIQVASDWLFCLTQRYWNTKCCNPIFNDVPQTKLMLAGERLDKINCFSKLPEN